MPNGAAAALKPEAPLIAQKSGAATKGEAETGRFGPASRSAGPDQSPAWVMNLATR
jgi:hypothetical protein